MNMKVLLGVAVLVITGMVFYFSSPLGNSRNIRTTVEWSEKSDSTPMKTKVEWVESTKNVAPGSRQVLMQ